MKGKENRGGWLAGPGDGLNMVSEAVKSKMTEGTFRTGRLLPSLVGSSTSGRTAGWEALHLGADVKQAVGNN